ncbi:unnamed protein product [Cunninghamella blakesleeana]
MAQEEKDKEIALQIQQQLEEEDNTIGFAVEPILDCPHIPTTIYKQVNIKQPCQVCKDDKENWLCTSCGIVLCSRYRQAHMQEHVEKTNHFVCLSYSDLSLWCFKCDSYIMHEVCIYIFIYLYKREKGG